MADEDEEPSCRLVDCPHCGEPIYTDVRPGDLIRCYSCGSPIEIKDVDREEVTSWTT